MPTPTVGEFLFRVSSNTKICRDHFRLTLQTDWFPPARPGQFLHLGPARWQGPADVEHDSPHSPANVPFLRRAFSIAGLTRVGDAAAADVIYRVVGAGTTWMAGLSIGDAVCAIGPLGHPLPEPPAGGQAWLIAGGVGLPPLLWFARTLIAQHRHVVLFMGAASKDLVPLEADYLEDGPRVRQIASEPVVVSTDDGTLGFAGNAVEALRSYAATHPNSPDAITCYTCGPERMMAGVAAFCRQQGHPCYVCLERAMACGIGTCQSCVVPIRPAPEADWVYKLCCSDGPVFPAEIVEWQPQIGAAPVPNH